MKEERRNKQRDFFKNICLILQHFNHEIVQIQIKFTGCFFSPKMFLLRKKTYFLSHSNNTILIFRYTYIYTHTHTHRQSVEKKNKIKEYNQTNNVGRGRGLSVHGLSNMAALLYAEAEIFFLECLGGIDFD